MKKLGVSLRSLLIYLAALLSAITTITLLEPILTFEAEVVGQIEAPAEKWFQVMEHLPTKAYLWMLAVYAVGSLVAGFIAYSYRHQMQNLHAIPFSLVVLLIIHLSFTPNPLWFWFLAPIFIATPFYLLHPALWRKPKKL